ncbi:Iron-sulfur cluster insertion protein erpA [Cecembia lonarensis LW9]|uniref:Iron-sulfur cluster insertion protein erpA n=2 Tax=Cecembia TaxID=1187078 RepID=K1LV62_CECL9|nr:Iron-sulfur cluster insertion protein erpA [Cecembia lonarensis LW9]
MIFFRPKFELHNVELHSLGMLIPIKITDKAQEEIKNIYQNKNIPADYFLRVGVKGGGCGGMSYMLGFDKPKEGDQQFEVEGIQVLIEKRHYMFLMGMKVDFYEGNDARGFTFINPDIPKRHDQ